MSNKNSDNRIFAAVIAWNIALLGCVDYYKPGLVGWSILLYLAGIIGLGTVYPRGLLLIKVTVERCSKLIRCINMSGIDAVAFPINYNQIEI